MSTPPPFPPPPLPPPGLPPPRRSSPWLAIVIVGGLALMTLAAGVALVAVLVLNGTFRPTPAPVADTPPVADVPPVSEPPIGDPVAPPPSPPADAPAPPPVVERDPARQTEPLEALPPGPRRSRTERAHLEIAHPPPPRVPVRVGGGVAAPRKIRDIRPVYPQIAVAARVQGVVIVEARIGTTGKVEDVRVLRSIPLLDQPAIDAVRQWEYEPTVLNGVPVPVIMTVTVNFTLR